MDLKQIFQEVAVINLCPKSCIYKRSWVWIILCLFLENFKCKLIKLSELKGSILVYLIFLHYCTGRAFFLQVSRKTVDIIKKENWYIYQLKLLRGCWVKVFYHLIKKLVDYICFNCKNLEQFVEVKALIWTVLISTKSCFAANYALDNSYFEKHK